MVFCKITYITDCPKPIEDSDSGRHFLVLLSTECSFEETQQRNPLNPPTARKEELVVQIKVYFILVEPRHCEPPDRYVSSVGQCKGYTSAIKALARDTRGTQCVVYPFVTSEETACRRVKAHG